MLKDIAAPDVAEVSTAAAAAAAVDAATAAAAAATAVGDVAAAAATAAIVPAVAPARGKIEEHQKGLSRILTNYPTKPPKALLD